MNRLLAVVGVLAAGLALAADAKDDAAKKELEKLNGTWQAVSIVSDGLEMPKENAAKTILTVKGNHFVVGHDDEVLLDWTIKLDPATSPKNIDATWADGRDKNLRITGIYELTEDTLKACFAPPDKERPTEFVSKANSGCRLFVMKRKKV